MNKTKGLFVGLCSNDYLYYIDEFPKENTKVKTAMFDKYIGGPAANAAITYALLGGDATLATCLGESEEADAIIQKLNNFGVKVLNFSADKTLPNTSNIIISKSGNRTIFSGQQRFKNIHKIDISAYDFYHFDCNQQEISLDILKQADTSKKVLLDAGSWKENIEKFLMRADIVIASEVFLNPQKQNLLEMPECKAKQKIITRGEKTVLFNGQEFPVPKVDVVDTLGAGDIFHGAFCYGYFAMQKSMENALLYAIDIASESVKHKGPRGFLLF
ncbi:MAG: carbohydrate kinase family protein [Lachnospiraceae bacterium]|nr:carbohydrate kinase family protein [Lachnospiraceae bacterium]